MADQQKYGPYKSANGEQYFLYGPPGATEDQVRAQGERLYGKQQEDDAQNQGGSMALGAGAMGLAGAVLGAYVRRKFPAFRGGNPALFMNDLDGAIRREINKGGLPWAEQQYQNYVNDLSSRGFKGDFPDRATFIASLARDRAHDTLNVLGRAQYAGPNTALDDKLGLPDVQTPVDIAKKAQSGQSFDYGKTPAGSSPEFDPSDLLHTKIGLLKRLVSPGDDHFNMQARGGNRALFGPGVDIDGNYLPNDAIDSYNDSRTSLLKAILSSGRDAATNPAIQAGALAGGLYGTSAYGPGDPVQLPMPNVPLPTLEGLGIPGVHLYLGEDGSRDDGYDDSATLPPAGGGSNINAGTR